MIDLGLILTAHDKFWIVVRFDGRNPPASFYIPPPRVLTSFPESLCLRWRDKQRSWVEVSSNLAVNDIWDEVGYTSLPPSFTFLVQPPGPSCLRSISHHSAQQIIDDESNILCLIVISFFFQAWIWEAHRVWNDGNMLSGKRVTYWTRGTKLTQGSLLTTVNPGLICGILNSGKMEQVNVNWTRLTCICCIILCGQSSFNLSEIV